LCEKMKFAILKENKTIFFGKEVKERRRDRTFRDFDLDVKFAWGIGLYMLNVLAYPVYWFMNIRKE